MKGRKKMQEVYDVLIAIVAFSLTTAVLAFCARIGWEIGGKL